MPSNIHTSIPNVASQYRHLIPTNATALPLFYATVEEVIKGMASMKMQGDGQHFFFKFVRKLYIFWSGMVS